MNSFNPKNIIKIIDESSPNFGKLGTVTRIRTDGRAWIKIDGIADKIMLDPSQCKLLEGTETPQVEIGKFGKDHWSTFAYIETRCVDYSGSPDRRHMRCNRERHPLLDGNGFDWNKKHGTRLNGYFDAKDEEVKASLFLEDHDDWDCVDDIIEAGLLENVGTYINPIYSITKKGKRVASEIRMHKSNGGHFATFNPSLESIKD